MSPNEHPNVGLVNLPLTTEKIYVHICAHWELMTTKKTAKFLKRSFHYARGKNALINKLLLFVSFCSSCRHKFTKEKKVHSLLAVASNIKNIYL